MTLLYLCIAWVFASAAVAMLPMRLQYIPGVALLLAAPILIAMLWVQVAWWAGLLALCAFISMFRNPLKFFWAKARGLNPEVPE